MGMILNRLERRDVRVETTRLGMGFVMKQNSLVIWVATVGDVCGCVCGVAWLCVVVVITFNPL